MRLADEDTGYSQLFLAILPTFVEALPPSPPLGAHPNPYDRSREVLKNSITLLRFEIQEMQEVLTEARSEYDLSEDDCFKASEALEDILFLLEELVDNAILSCYGDPPVTKLPKLETLRGHILNYNATLTLNTPSHRPPEILNLLSYGNEATHFRRTGSGAQRFNSIMRGVYDSLMIDTVSQMTQVFQQQRQQEHASSDEDIGKTDIYQAQNLCDTTKTLFKLMTEEPKSCQTPHSALIHLTGFSQPEIDMILSVCGEKDTKKWHQVFWTSKNPPGDPSLLHTPTDSICSILKKSRKFKNRLRIYLQRDGTWKCATPSSADRTNTYIIAPALTLEELLNAKQNGGANMTFTRLLKKDKLYLAVAIARSLLYLLGSPLLRSAWKTGNIYVTQTTDGPVGSGLRTKPYIPRELTGELSEDGFQEPDKESSEDGLGGSANGNSFILDLGVLLWELLFGQKITITPEDEEDDDEEDQNLSLYNALNREEGNSRECCVEKPFLDIISNCLNLYSQTQLDDQTFRSTMYWNVVKPLKDYLESYYRPEKQSTTAKRNKPTQPISRSIPGNSSPKPGLCSRGRVGLQGSVKKDAVVEGNIDVVHQLRTPSSLRTTFPNSELLASHGNITDSNSWLDRFDLVNQHLKTLPQVSKKAIKVAVLDTGCNLSAHYFNGPGIRQEERLSDHWLDCLDESDDPVDDDPKQHGTAMVTLLLRLLPGAEVYVARVLRDAEGLPEARKSISEAILHAAQEWDVDIITMSFGFPDEVPSIRDAITDAEKIKRGKILFFAAANNDGLNGKEMFPAFSESVISVRGTSHDGSFVPQFNPETWSHNDGMKLYGTISQNVPCDWTAGRLTKSGCSVATAIMAAIAAAIIRFVSCEASFDSRNVQELIRTRRGILSVFSVMTEGQEQTRLYLAPWQLFDDGDINGIRKVYMIGHALSKLPPKG